MFKNYIITAFRNFKKNKTYLLINILSMSLGLTCCLVFYTILKHEMSFDGFHLNKDNIYRVTENTIRDYGMEYNGVIPNAMPSTLAEEMGPQVDVITIFSNLGANIDVTHNKRRQVYPEWGNITFANPNFLEHLNFPIKSGARAEILSDKFKVFITERIAKKYFGQDNPIGEIITFDEDIELEVVGILENTPRNTSTPFDLLISFPTLYEWNGNYARNWGSHWAASCYIVNHGQEDLRAIEDLITQIALKNLSDYEQERVTFTLQPIEEIHTDTRFDDDLNYIAPMEVLMGLAVMAIIILLASVLNFINLATAQAIQRSREVGIRKTLGSSRLQLVYQFLGETFLVVIISLLLALTLGQVFIDQLNAYLKIISYDVGYDQSTLLFTVLLVIVVTFLAGLYLSWVLSRYEPAEALNNQITLSKGSGKKWLRRGLVIMQFVVANLLLITTLIVTTQMQFVKNKNLGFDGSNVGLIEFPAKMNDQIGLIKADLDQKAFIEEVTQAMSPPQYHSNWGTHYKISGFEQNERMHANVKFIDQDYLDFYKIPLISGRNLTNRYTTDTTLNVIVNREFLERAGVPIENAVGRNISFMAEWKGQIIGVIEDFHVYGLQEKMKPVMMMYKPSNMHQLNLRLGAQSGASQVAEIEEIFNKYGQGEYFAYEWLGDAIAENYIVENIAFRTFQVFSLVAVGIGIFGLYGLVSFMAARNKKSISIRKVFGAGIGSILNIFSREFVHLVIISFIIAAPFSYYLCQGWLENFEYRIEISLNHYLIAGGLVALIAVGTVGFKSYKVATANPIDSLRHE